MKKFELVAAVAKKVPGQTQESVNKVIDAMAEVIVTECVKNGGDVDIRSMGKFRQKVNAARQGINPLNKQKISIKESHTLRFTPSNSIKITVD